MNDRLFNLFWKNSIILELTHLYFTKKEILCTVSALLFSTLPVVGCWNGNFSVFTLGCICHPHIHSPTICCISLSGTHELRKYAWNTPPLYKPFSTTKFFSLMIAKKYIHYYIDHACILLMSFSCLCLDYFFLWAGWGCGDSWGWVHRWGKKFINVEWWSPSEYDMPCYTVLLFSICPDTSIQPLMHFVTISWILHQT